MGKIRLITPSPTTTLAGGEGLKRTTSKEGWSC